MLKIAHRGAAGYEPENTMAAFRKAVVMKADGIELDVLLSADGQLVVFHDDTLERMTNGIGNVSDFALAELKQFLIEGQHRIPTLVEVLEEVRQHCFVNIELKSAEATEPLVRLIEEMVAKNVISFESIIVSSFDWNSLQKIHQVQPAILLGVLTETDLEEALAFAKQIKAYSIHPNYNLLNAENTKAIQENGILVFPWTVNEPQDIKELKSYNVNGIITDFTDRI